LSNRVKSHSKKPRVKVDGGTVGKERNATPPLPNFFPLYTGDRLLPPAVGEGEFSCLKSFLQPRPFSFYLGSEKRKNDQNEWKEIKHHHEKENKQDTLSGKCKKKKKVTGDSGRSSNIS
jgi:hypothetical protein